MFGPVFPGGAVSESVVGRVRSRLCTTATIVLACRNDAFVSGGPLGRAGDVARHLRAYAEPTGGGEA